MSEAAPATPGRAGKNSRQAKSLIGSAVRLVDMPLISGPKGAPDILPPESEQQEWIIDQAEQAFQVYGYRLIETPVFEYTELFERGLEGGSDIVTKEMYTFEDKGGRSLTLRPDMTAPVLRAILEHGLDRGGLPVKLYYRAPVFRHERPQSGRYRQFRQVGVEAVGAPGPSIDAEVIALASEILFRVGLGTTDLRLNSIGHEGCRATYMPQLVDFLRRHAEELCEDCRRKITSNPLRTFDCKRPQDRQVMKDAPLITDHLCFECKDHYERLKDLLRAGEIPFAEDPTLVRGLDYYSRTAFEFVAPDLGSQNAVGAGGRYDGLAEQIGASEALPGIGFGLGVDRIALALSNEGRLWAGPPERSVDVFIVTVGEPAGRTAFEIVGILRRSGVSADMDHTGRGVKGQFRAADRARARWVVVIGEREAESGLLTLKDMDKGGESSIALDDLVSKVRGPGINPSSPQAGAS